MPQRFVDPSITMRPGDWLDDSTMDSLGVLLSDSTEAGSDLSNVTQQLAESVRKVKGCHAEQLAWMRYVCNVMVALPIASLGIVANLVSFVVLRRQKPRLTTTVLLQGLALADTAVLTAMTLLYFLRYVSQCGDLLQGYEEIYDYIFRWAYPSTYFFRMASTWLTVLLTIDRYIAVCHPLHAMSICTIKAAKRHMAIVVLAAFVCSVPRFFEYHMNSGNAVRTKWLASRWYTVGYQLVTFFALMYLLPMALLVILNSRLLCALYSASAYRTSLHHQVNAQTRANNRSITIVVLTIVLLCVIGDLTGMVDHLLYAVRQCFRVNQSVETFRSYLSNVRNIILTVNSAGNFVIYCLCSRNFRLALRKTFTCSDASSCLKKRKGKQKPAYTGPTYYLSLTRTSERKLAKGISNSNGRKYEYERPMLGRNATDSQKLVGLPATVPILATTRDQRPSSSDEQSLSFYLKLFHSHDRNGCE